MSSAPPYEFSWGPDGCDVYTLTVLSGGAVHWHLFTIEDRNGLHSPIRYGVTPDGGRSSGADSLVPGRPYTAEMTRLNAAGLEELVARQGFTISQ